MGAPQDKGIYQNQLTFVLPKGTISVEGVQFFTRDGTVSAAPNDERAIVGGTGAFAGARGTVVSTTQPDGSREQQFKFTG